MCPKCFDEIKLNPPKPHKAVDIHKIYCATQYKDNMQKLIRAIKYHNKKELAKQAGILLKDYWEKIPDKEFNYEIVPMPIFKKREKQRGYNQSELIAKEFAKYFDYEVNTNLIRRIKDTPALYKLSKKEREDVLSGAFEYIGENYSGRPVLIIDDICTSGTSVTELINELKRHGVYDITVLTCASAGSFYQI
jgi:ComF family protein